MRSWTYCAAVALGCGLAMPAQSALVTYEFTGFVDSVPSELSPPFSAGQEVSGSWTVDTSVGALPGSDASLAPFPALTSFSISTDTYAASDSSGFVTVESGSFGDGYMVVSSTSPMADAIDGWTTALFRFLLRDSGGLVFDAADDPLPTDLNLADFDERLAQIIFRNNEDSRIVSSVLFSVTSLTRVMETDPAPVPEPSTLALFGLGLAGLAALRARRRPD